MTVYPLKNRGVTEGQWGLALGDDQAVTARLRDLPIDTRALIVGLDARQGRLEMVGQLAEVGGQDGFDWRITDLAGAAVGPSFPRSSLYDASDMYDTGDVVEIT